MEPHSSPEVETGKAMTRLLRIEPVDSLFFRGGRPFGPAVRAISGLPRPQTVAGALRTAMLRKAEIDLALIGQGVRAGLTFKDAAGAAGTLGAAVGMVGFRGPWFGRQGELLFPVPATLRIRQDCKGIVRLDPLREVLHGWDPQEKGMKPLWWKGRERLERISGYLTRRGMDRFLGGGVPKKTDLVKSDSLYSFDDRTGIGIDADRSVAADGMMYAVRLLVLQPAVCLYMQVNGPAEALRLFPEAGMLVPLGGESRRVVVTPEAQVDIFPTVRRLDTGDGKLVVLITPALAGGWCPSGLRPLAASVPGFEAVSGWDMARGGPKPNRFAIPAGSVFCLRPGTEVQDLSADAELGWGSYVEGTWEYA